MRRFATERDAKEFLVAEIEREADRQGRPLTEIERKMLYFSESSWTLPNIDEVAETFDQQLDAKRYERDVAGLARSARKRAGRTGAAAWSEAVKRLEAGDHYLLVMVRQTGNRRPGEMTWRTTVAVILLILGLGFIRPLVLERFLGHFPTWDDTAFFTWAALAVLAAVYLAVCFVVGRNRVEGWLERAVLWSVQRKRP